MLMKLLAMQANSNHVIIPEQFAYSPRSGVGRELDDGVWAAPAAVFAELGRLPPSGASGKLSA